MKIYLFSDAIIQGWSNNEASPLIINASLVGEIDTASPAVYRFVPSVTSGEVLVLNSASGATAVETYAEKLAFNVAKINGAPTTQRAFAVEFNGLSFVKEVGGKAMIYANGKTYEAVESIATLISAIEAFEVPGSDLDAPEEAAVQALIDAATGDLAGNTVIQNTAIQIAAANGDLGGDTVEVFVASQIAAGNFIDSATAALQTKAIINTSISEGLIVADGAGAGGGTIAHNFNLAMGKRSHIVVKAFGETSGTDIPFTLSNFQINSVDYTFTGATPAETVNFIAYNLSVKI